jgi:hypothetical protein
MDDPADDPHARIAAFLAGIGIALRAGPVGEGSFLPGVTIEGGAIVYDPSRPYHPGDLLHEAGHVAVTEPERRGTLGGTMEDGGGEEMAAIAWSYAAARHIGLDPRIVFHEAGYKGGAAALVEAFEAGAGCGVPLLAWYGLTDTASFPRMERWLR